MCLAQGHTAVTLVWLEPAAPRSRINHSTTEPLRSLNKNVLQIKSNMKFAQKQYIINVYPLLFLRCFVVIMFCVVFIVFVMVVFLLACDFFLGGGGGGGFIFFKISFKW